MRSSCSYALCDRGGRVAPEVPGRDLGLEPIDAARSRRCGRARDGAAPPSISAASQRCPVLVLEQDELAACIEPGIPPRVGQQEQCQEAERLGLVGHQHAQELREPDRLGAQLLANRLVAGTRRIPLVEHEVQHAQHTGQPVGEQVPPTERGTGSRSRGCGALRARAVARASARAGETHARSRVSSGRRPPAASTQPDRRARALGGST